MKGYLCKIIWMIVFAFVRASTEEGEIIRRFIVNRTIFVDCLEELVSSEKVASLQDAIELPSTPMQRKILEIMLSENSSSKVENVVEILVSLIHEIRVNKELIEKVKTDLADKGGLWIKRVLSKNDTMPYIEKIISQFSHQNPSYDNYLKHTISHLMKILSTKNKKKLAGDFVAACVNEMSGLLDILDSMSSLTWGIESKSFDKTDINLTRPGFGVIVLFKTDDALQDLMKSCSSFLIMKTHKDCLHMTVFQVFITFQDDYDSFSLPNNLLECLYSYIEKAISKDIASMDGDLKPMFVSVTNDWHIMGRDYPSHLTIGVNCKDVCMLLDDFKKKVNLIGYEWMIALGEELREHNFDAEIVPKEVGSTLVSDGWSLVIGYTSNPDYRTHITLGMLKTNNTQLNETIIKAHGDRTRDITSKFSSEEGDDARASIIRLMNGMVESYRTEELINLKDSDISGYPTLEDQVRNAVSGKAVKVSKKLIDEWGKIKIRVISEKLEDKKLPKKETNIYVSRIHMGILNMQNVQNFEPISAELQ